MTGQFAVVRAYMSGEAYLVKVEKITDKTLTGRERWSGEWSTRSSRTLREKVIAMFDDEASASAALRGGEAVWRAHADAVRLAEVVLTTAKAARRDAWIAALKTGAVAQP